MAISNLLFVVIKPVAPQITVENEFIYDVLFGMRDYVSGIQSQLANYCVRLLDDLMQFNPDSPMQVRRWDIMIDTLRDQDGFYLIVNHLIILAKLREIIRTFGDPSGELHRRIEELRITITYAIDFVGAVMSQ